MAVTTSGGGSAFDFTGGPAAVVADVFNIAWDKAQSLSSSTEQGFARAIEMGVDAPTMTPARIDYSSSVIEPTVNIPINAEGASVERFEEFSGMVIDKLAGLFGGFMTEFFPNECGYLQKAQQWICDALTNGGTGIKPHVENQIWQRDRARVLADVKRAGDELLAAFAARGFPLPPGAATHAMHLTQFDGQNKIAQASRDVAIKQVEIEIENVRFAVESAISLYGSAIAAASDYIKALSIGPTAAMQVVPSVTDSQSRLIGAASEYYRARIAVKELELRATLPNAEMDQAARAKRGDWQIALVHARVRAAMAAAQGLSSQAAAALNGLHASASIGGSSSTSVGYSYGGDVAGDVPPKTVA